MNWVEILAAQRAADYDFGHYATQGHEYNYAIPGYDTVQWMDIIEADFWDPLYYIRFRMQQDYDEVGVVVIMLGGNDIRANYGDLYDPGPGDITPTEFKNTVLTNLGKIITEIRDENGSVPIVLADVPDLSIAPDIIADHPDATKRAGVTVIVGELNQEIATLAASRAVTLANVSLLSDRLLSPGPIYIGAIEMINDKDPTRENRPHYLFCKEGLHPSTNGQSIIANVLIDAINSATNHTVQKLESREVITDLLGLNPDQPYINWASNKNLTEPSMTVDSDGDGIPNLGEYLLGLNPLVVDTSHIVTLQDIGGTDYLTLGYSPDLDALRLADVIVKYSLDLDDWLELPNGSLIDLGNGSFQARLPIGGLPDNENRAFLRMEFILRP